MKCDYCGAGRYDKYWLQRENFNAPWFDRLNWKGGIVFVPLIIGIAVVILRASL